MKSSCAPSGGETLLEAESLFDVGFRDAIVLRHFGERIAGTEAVDDDSGRHRYLENHRPAERQARIDDHRARLVGRGQSTSAEGEQPDRRTLIVALDAGQRQLEFATQGLLALSRNVEKLGCMAHEQINAIGLEITIKQRPIRPECMLDVFKTRANLRKWNLVITTNCRQYVQLAEIGEREQAALFVRWTDYWLESPFGPRPRSIALAKTP